MTEPIKCQLSGAVELWGQLNGPKPGRYQMTPEREQDIVDHLLQYRNKNETKRVHRVGLTTIYNICKKRGIRI